MPALPRGCRLGLTGGLGSGKSTVAHMLAEAGAQIIDADALSRACTAAGGAAVEAISQRFGPAYIDDSGALKRAAMRALVFAQPQARLALEAIVHPLVQQQAAAQAQAAIDAGCALVVHDIPLLAEHFAHWRQRLDAVWVVDCDPETQVARAMRRDGISRQAAQAIIDTQATRAQRLHIATAVIDNGAHTTPDALRAQVRALAAPLGLIIGAASPPRPQAGASRQPPP